MDYPAHPNARITLVNDLDLRVIDKETKKKLYGNGKKDNLNTVEHVDYKNIDKKDHIVKVIVIGKNVPHGPQPYALVVSGVFEKLKEC
eukprot:EC822971.1.p1 GENE.EC822971.1~~EC822971.1.p1  ORF type:complete len:88 (-),score=41.89 EC822971.1:5-268(-)